LAKFERVSSKTRKMILKQLKENFGITDFPYVILSSGKRRFWICPPKVAQINFKGLLIHSIGFYFANIDKNILRLSFDATQVFANQIKNNILEIDKESAEKWLRGESLQLNKEVKEKKVVVIKYKNDFLGCGIISNKKIWNHVPKDRRTIVELPTEFELPD